MDTPAATPAPSAPEPATRSWLFGLLGFSAGLPLYMFSTILAARLTTHGVDLTIIGFFGWVQLLPTVKFAWAPLLDRFAVPGLGGVGKRLGWILVAQLGIVASLVAMAITAGDANLPATALFAVLLAFWTTTLEVSADAWRIELAPTPREQAPLVAATLWGYRGAMVAAGSGALLVADRAGWTLAYLGIATAAFVPVPILLAMARGGGRLAAGLAGIAALLAASLGLAAGFGWIVLALAQAMGIGAGTDATRGVLVICLVPFVTMAAALPWIRGLPATSRARRSAVVGPYVDIFWRLGYRALPVLGFITCYRMGDVLTLALSKPLQIAAGYDLTTMGVADGAVALPASLAGVALGAWLAVRVRLLWALAIGAVGSAFGNWIFVWLWYRPPSALVIYVATALDQFAHGVEGAVFVVYLSMLVNPRWPAAQYAFLSGFAFLLPRLIAGAAGSIQKQIGYDGFFALSGTLSLAAVLFLPALAGARVRADDRRG